MSKRYADEITYGIIFIFFILGSLAGVVIEGLFCLFTKGGWESRVYHTLEQKKESKQFQRIRN